MNTSPHDLDTVELFTEKYSSECVCRNCGTLFLARRSKVLCKNCYEAALFAQVKKYIQQNEVTEFEVANYFRIPLRLVKNGFARVVSTTKSITLRDQQTLPHLWHTD